VIRRLMCAALAAGMLSACTKVGTVTETNGDRQNAWTKPGVFTYAEPTDPVLLNPILAASAPVLDLSMLLYSYAVRYDDKSNPVPDALIEVPTIENGDVSKDGLTLKYKLRPNIKWHDGVKMTSKDLWFTWKCVMNTHNNVVTTDGYKDIGSIDYSDPLVAVIHMKRIYAPFLQQIFGVNGNAAILPEHILAKYNDDRGSFNKAPYQSAPIGSGPFKFVQWQRGAYVRMEANPDFYLGRPKINEITFRIMPDENTMATQVKTHEIDMAVHATGSQYAQYQNVPGVTLISPPVFTYDHIDFNLRRPIFSDVRVRQALAFAVDRKGILDKVSHGLGTLTDTDESPEISKAYNPNTMHYPFDPAKARQLLDAAGWVAGPDGIRVKGGQRFAFVYSTQTESQNGKAVQAQVQSEWHDIGAEVTVKNASTTLFFDNTAKGVLQGGNYDVAGFAWGGAADPDSSAVYSGDNFAPHGQNALFWNDRVATAALNDALSTVDWARRKRDYFTFQERFASQVPSIVLYFRKEPLAYNADLKGFKPSPVISPFWDPWDWSI